MDTTDKILTALLAGLCLVLGFVAGASMADDHQRGIAIEAQVGHYEVTETGD